MPFTRGIGLPELVIILVIVMIIFGAGKLPSIGRSIGGAIREFRQSSSGKEDGKQDATAEAQSEEKRKSVT